MLNVTYSTVETPATVQFCAHCGKPATAEMIAVPVANRNGKPAYFHAACFDGACIAADAITGKARGGYNYRVFLYPDTFDINLHGEMLDARNTAWAFDGNRYASPLYLNGYYHKKLVSIDRYCPSGRCDVQVFDAETGEHVGTAKVSWGNRDKHGRWVARDPYKAVQDETARVKGLAESNAKTKKQKRAKK